VRLTGVERLLGRLADVSGRVEIGFADLEVDDRAALGLEGTGTGTDLEGALGADGLHASSDPKVRDGWHQDGTSGRMRSGRASIAAIPNVKRVFLP
jgi:hypothetical protein